MYNKNLFAIAFFIVMFAGVYSQFAIAKSSSATTNSSSTGFKDGCADSSITNPSSPKDLHFNQHPNAGHHSKSYLQGYADGLKKCGQEKHQNHMPKNLK